MSQVITDIASALGRARGARRRSRACICRCPPTARRTSSSARTTRTSSPRRRQGIRFVVPDRCRRRVDADSHRRAARRVHVRSRSRASWPTASTRWTARSSIGSAGCMSRRAAAADTKVPVPLYRIGLDGVREPLAVEVANPTSLALGPDGLIYISSRFEGHVHRLMDDDRVGAVCDRAGRADRTRVRARRHAVRRRSIGIDSARLTRAAGRDVRERCRRASRRFISRTVRTAVCTRPRRRWRRTIRSIASRPIGWSTSCATASAGRKDSRSIRPARCTSPMRSPAVPVSTASISPKPQPKPELVLSAPMLVGVAFDPRGGLILASNDTVWKLDVDLKPFAANAAEARKAAHEPVPRQADRRARRLGRSVAQACAWGQRSRHAGDWRGHRRRHLRRDRNGGGGADRTQRRGHPVRRRAGAHLFLHPARLRVRPRGALLRGTRVDDSAGWKRVRVFVRDARRARGVDHRLGPDPRIRGWQRRGRNFVGRLLQDAHRGHRPRAA